MKKLLLLLPFIILLAGCGKEEKKNVHKPVPPVDTTEQAPSEITYQKFAVSGKEAVDSLTQLYGEDGKYIIYALNRKDKQHVRKGDTLVVPDTLYKDFLKYSPFPAELKAAAEMPKLLFVSQKVQAIALYENGIQIRWAPTSTGKRKTTTPNGLFFTNWKAKETKSTVNEEWILPWCFNLDNMEGVSMHQYELPGYPASHACVRLLEADAKFIYYWAEQWILTEDGSSVKAYGTPVIIFDSYAYGKKAPWKFLPDNKDTLKISGADIDSLLGKYSGTILKRIAVRDSVVNNK